MWFVKINGDVGVPKNSSTRDVVVVTRDINGENLGMSALLSARLDNSDTLEALSF